MAELDERLNRKEEAMFVLDFVDHSDKRRKFYQDIWEETLKNYLVRPRGSTGAHQLVQYPYLTEDNRSMRGCALKDPESHQIVETLLAEEMLALFGEDGFVQALPVGYEDAVKSRTTSNLLSYVLRLDGHYRAFYEWGKDSKIFGTGILMGDWFAKREVTVQRTRTIVDGIPIDGIAQSNEYVYNDYRLRPLDLMDFWPDPGKTRIGDMVGVAHRFSILGGEAKRLADNGFYNKEAVNRAITNKMETDAKKSADRLPREGLDRPDQPQVTSPDFVPLVGMAYYGDVPYMPEDRIRRRRVELIGGELVKSKPFYGRVPFFEHTTRPIQGRFYGIAPLETMRYTQDYADALLTLNSEMAAYAAAPPHLVDRDANIDYEALRRFSRDVPILADNAKSAIGQVPYDPPLNDSAAIYGQLKNQMREGAGALGALQGAEGPSRESATGFAGRLQQAKGRPEADITLVEREYLPPIGKHILSYYQRFLRDDKELQDRVGQMPEPAKLESILTNYDVKFVGSRIANSRLERIQGYRELIAMMGNPQLAAMIPLPKVLARIMKDLGLHEEAMEVGFNVFDNVILGQVTGPGALQGNGNGTTPAQAPLGQQPAQAEGNTLV